MPVSNLTARVRSIIGDLTLPFGLEARLYSLPGTVSKPGDPILKIGKVKPCTFTGTRKFQATGPLYLKEEQTNSDIIRAVLAACVRWLEHEAREEFKYKNQPVLSPHIDLEAVAARMATGLHSELDAFAIDEKPVQTPPLFHANTAQLEAQALAALQAEMLNKQVQLPHYRMFGLSQHIPLDPHKLGRTAAQKNPDKDSTWADTACPFAEGTEPRKVWLDGFKTIRRDILNKARASGYTFAEQRTGLAIVDVLAQNPYDSTDERHTHWAKGAEKGYKSGHRKIEDRNNNTAFLAGKKCARRLGHRRLSDIVLDNPYTPGMPTYSEWERGCREEYATIQYESAKNEHIRNKVERDAWVEGILAGLDLDTIDNIVQGYRRFKNCTMHSEDAGKAVLRALKAPLCEKLDIDPVAFSADSVMNMAQCVAGAATQVRAVLTLREIRAIYDKVPGETLPYLVDRLVTLGLAAGAGEDAPLVREVLFKVQARIRRMAK